MKIGVTAVQGDVSEHLEIVEKAMKSMSLSGRAIAVRRPPDLEAVDSLIIPGGESTTISKLLVKFDLFDRVVERANGGMPVMGTCAGCILLAKEGDEQVDATGTRLLGLMDMSVDRNAFGRQRESFEAELKVDGVGPLRGVFIRAPAIRKVWGECHPLGWLEEVIVVAQQEHLLALAFHPELSGKTELHEYFLGLV